MLKKLFVGLFAIILATAGLNTQFASATDSNIVIDNILDLCTYMRSYNYSLDDSRTCDAYTSDQTTVTLTRPIYIRDNVTLKNLDITFARASAQMYIYEGSLTIDGGHYASPNCVVWIQYRNVENPGYYVPITTIKINSGVFEATLTTKNSEEAPSPICLLTHFPLSDTDPTPQELIANYLPAGRKFVNLETRTLTTEIPVTEGTVHISKDQTELTDVEYLITTKVVVVEDEGLGEETEEEPEEEDEDIPEEEPEEVVEEVETPEEPAPEELPKAPDTGTKQNEENRSSTITVDLSLVIFTVVIITTIIWGYKYNNR